MSLLALQSLDAGKLCAKRWRVDGTIESYARITWWRPLEARGISTIDQLGAALARLSQRPDLCVVRGSLIEPAVQRMRRALQGEGAGLRDGDRSWICCDLDHLEPPDDVRAELTMSPSGAIDIAGRWARTQLPGWLQDVTIVAQYSASAGRDGYKKAKLHIWAWLARPVCCASLDSYARGIDVLDPAVCRPVQPIYTADPIIEDGWTAGPTRRLAVIRGREDTAEPPEQCVDLATWEARRRIEELERQQRAARWAEANKYRSPLAVLSRAARRMESVVTHVIDDMARAPESRRHGTLISGAVRIVKVASELGLDPQADLQKLADVALARLPSDRRHEPAEVIEYAMRCA